MAAATFETEFLKSLNLLTKEQQEHVIHYMKSLLIKTQQQNRQSLLQFAGIFQHEDLKEISSAIELGCENIDQNEW
ncbi:MAG: hypothetical protein FJZ78_07195 [Bacteroidetes bacterium]|nr:hypothetical protein [Bacteroidota bacterium]